MVHEINLQNTTVKRNQVTAIHLIAAFLLIVMGFITFVTPFSINIYNAGKEHTNAMPHTWVNNAGIAFMIIGIAIIVISIFFNKKLIQKQKNLWIRIVEIICFASILGYCLYEQWTLPAIYAGGALLGILLAYYLEKVNLKQPKISIDAQQVSHITGIKTNQWKWSEIERIIIKHNVITIDTVTNKRYQFIADLQAKIDHDSILAFANEAIQKAIPDRIKDNW